MERRLYYDADNKVTAPNLLIQIIVESVLLYTFEVLTVSCKCDYFRARFLDPRHYVLKRVTHLN